MLQGLPLGTSDFRSLRVNNEIYVDKTELIYEMVEPSQRRKLLLARPRRFGKSLLISTFESLFKNGLKDFKGLAIEKYWCDKKYQVVRLDLSEIKEFSTPDEFEQKFYEKLITKFSGVGFQYKNNGLLLMTQLSEWLSLLEPSCLVVLIDEYDAPLTNCLDQPNLFKDVRSAMSELFLTLKSNEGCLRFFFMTGITKLSNTSIFSAFNNLEDISLYPKYGTLLGYTEEEIKLYFKDYLSRAAALLGMAEDQILEQLRANYDGFSFDQNASSHVYCPWSVLKFFNYPELSFQNYWYASGGQPSVLKKYLMNHELEKPISFDQVKQVRLSELNAAQQYNDLSIDVLLTQSGYLTIKSVLKNGYAVLGYPNQEVALSMAQLYSDELLKGNPLEDPQGPMISDIMATGSTEEVVKAFNRAVNAIDYQRYPIIDEASCRAYLQVLLIGAAMMPSVEIHNAHGRSDMEVQAGSRHWVFEFKYASTDSEVETLLSKAIEQIRSQHYGEQVLDKKLIRVALVFNAKERQFTAWQIV